MSGLRCLPGRVAVRWPIAESSDSLVQIPASVRWNSHNRGQVCEARKVEVVSSGFPGIREGETVAVRLDAACLSLDHADYPWIPEGEEIRIYGVHEQVLNSESDVVVFKCC